MENKLPTLLNIVCPILVTLIGIVMEVRSLFVNTVSPILITLSGIVMEDILV
jgi:hypothetical protein